MFVRIVALLAVLAIGTLALTWAFTGERKYLKFAWRLFLVALAGLLVILVLLFFERVLSA